MTAPTLAEAVAEACFDIWTEFARYLRLGSAQINERFKPWLPVDGSIDARMHNGRLWLVLGALMRGHSDGCILTRTSLMYQMRAKAHFPNKAKSAMYLAVECVVLKLQKLVGDWMGLEAPLTHSQIGYGANV